MQTSIGRYVVEGPLGAGGMGSVLRGRDPDLDRPVAIKLLHAHRSLDERQRARLVREAKALAALAHPNIVNVFEVGTERDQAFVAMELVEGLPLHAWARGRSAMEIVRMYVQAGRGLHAAHVRGIVHRDFKPSNVLVGDDGRARVLDFGLATLDEAVVERGRSASVDGPAGTALSRQGRGDADARGLEISRAGEAGGGGPASGQWVPFDALSGDLTADDTVVGTPAYMAPEQHTGEPVTAATDQFGFCVALWEALTGRRPYPGDDLVGVRVSIQRGRIEPVPASVEAPRRVLRLLERGLAIDPRARWPSLDVLCDRLEAALRPRRRWPWVVAAGAGVGLALVLIPGSRSRCDAGQDAAAPFAAAARDELARRFEGSGVPEAAAAWPSVRAALDEHATAWSEAYARACASEVTDAEGQRAFDRQMGCLQQQRDSLRAVIDVLAHGEPSTLPYAGDAVAQLRPVSACLEALADDPSRALPEDPAAAKVASELRAQLVAAEALLASGRLEEAEAQARVALEGATGLGFDPVRVEAELQLGIVVSRRGRPKDAEPLLARAYWGASDLDYPAVGAEAAIELAWQVGYLQGRHDDGIEWVRHFESMQRRAGEDPGRHVAMVLGPIYFDAGEFAQARPYIEQELAEALASGDGTHTVAIARMNLANLLLELDEEERAAEEFRRAQEVLEREFPDGHPDLALALINRADLELERDLSLAETLLQRGVAMSLAINGELHPATGLGLSKLGAVHRRRKHPDAAVATLERAVRAYATGAPAERLQAEHELAEALREAGRAAEAEARWRAVLDVAETELGDDHELAIRARLGLGTLAQDRGDVEAARREHEAALAKAADGSEVKAEAQAALDGLR